MTVHDLIASFCLGEERRLPSIVTANTVLSYGWERFGWMFKIVGDSVKRVCPTCYR